MFVCVSVLQFDSRLCNDLFGVMCDVYALCGVWCYARYVACAWRCGGVAVRRAVNFPVHGDTSIMKHLWQVVASQGYAVVVVAEGAGAEHLTPTGSMSRSVCLSVCLSIQHTTQDTSPLPSAHTRPHQLIRR